MAKLDSVIFMTTAHVNLSWQRRAFHLWSVRTSDAPLGGWDRVTRSLMQWNRTSFQVRGTQRFKKAGTLPLSLWRCLVIHAQLRNIASCLNGCANRGPGVCIPRHVYSASIYEVGNQSKCLILQLRTTKFSEVRWYIILLALGWNWSKRQTLKQQQTLLTATAARFKD